jgi:hypothetical protein
MYSTSNIFIPIPNTTQSPVVGIEYGTEKVTALKNTNDELGIDEVNLNNNLANTKSTFKPAFGIRKDLNTLIQTDSINFGKKIVTESFPGNAAADSSIGSSPLLVCRLINSTICSITSRGSGAIFTEAVPSEI